MVILNHVVPKRKLLPIPEIWTKVIIIHRWIDIPTLAGTPVNRMVFPAI